MLAYCGDADDEVPATSSALLQYARSASGPVWGPLSATATNSVKKDYSIEPGVVNPSTCQGRLICGLDSGPATAVGAGALFIEYTVDLWDRASFASQ